MRILEFQEGDENQPPIWNNEQYIPYFKRAKDCPVIDDFEVALVNWTFPDLEPEPNESPFSIYFYSKGRGLISGYEWNMKELCEDKFEIPLNYYDDDMGTLQIYTRKGFTHFEEGKYEKPEYFPTPWS